MRNLKRALSLLLSSTMVLGMLVMGSSAAGYKDVDDSNKNQEAIEVLQAVGVMSGVDNKGNFNPDGSVTRNQMAVIMAHLLKLDYDYYRGTNPFTDVPEWAAPYVAACAAEGVIAGIGNNQFGGEMKVTAAQASLMIMKALGYFQNAEDFGSDWQVATISQASKISLFDQINATAESALTRGQVAQMVLNGLQAKTVYFTGDKGIQIGDVTVGYRAEYTPKTGTDKKYNALITGKTDISQQGQYYIQLGEELYDGQLRKVADADDFDRPAFTWSYKGEEIGTYVDWSLLVQEYTTGVTGKELYNLLTSNIIKNYEFSYYVDGKEDQTIKASNMIRTNDYNYKTTDNGALTQVFVDNEKEYIVITTINTYLAKAEADYNEKRDELSLKIYADKYVEPTVKAADIPAIADVKEGDIILVNVAETSKKGYEVITIGEPEVIADTKLTKYSALNYLVTDGTQYDYALTGSSANVDKESDYYHFGKGSSSDWLLDKFNQSALDNTYNIYLDPYGYVIGTEKVSGELKYVFMTGYDRPMTHLGIKTAEAGAIFLDGTMQKIEVNVTKTNDNITDDDIHDGYSKLSADAGDGWMSRYNRWFTYTVNKDGVYTLDPVDHWMNVHKTETRDVINSSSVVLRSDMGDKDSGNRAWGNDDSIYITVDTSGNDYNNTIISEVNNVYTGVQNVDIKLSGKDGLDNVIFACYGEDGYVIGAVVLGEDVNNTKNFAYGIDKDAMSEYVKDDDGYYYWDFEAVVDGEIKTLTVKTEYTSVITKIRTNIVTGEGAMLELTYDKDGYVVDALVLEDGMKYDGENKEDFIYGSKDKEYTNPKEYAENYKVYLVDVDEETGLKTNTAGNTMWINVENATDNGLAINAGAPIIVVQDVYSADGKTYLETEVEVYTNFNAAFKALAKEDMFKGQIGAVLNEKGTAEYVVLNSAIKDGVETDDGSSANSSYYMTTGVGAKTVGNKTEVLFNLYKKSDDSKVKTGSANYEYTVEILSGGKWTETLTGSGKTNFADGNFAFNVPVNGKTNTTDIRITITVNDKTYDNVEGVLVINAQ